MTFQEIFNRYFQQTGLSERAFAYALTERLAASVSNQTVNNWRNERTEPDTDFLLNCLVAYQDWRRDFARDCLVAKFPHVFQIDAGGRLILSVAA